MAADNPARADVSYWSADPMTRAHACEADPWPRVILPWEQDREAVGRRKLRKGRDQCTATRRDGQSCQAPAVKGGLVCRRHGGAAPQVLIKFKHQELQLAAYATNHEWEEARGTAAEFDALCKALQAGRDLDAYEAKLRRLRELRAEVKRRRAEQRTAGTPEEP